MRRGFSFQVSRLLPLFLLVVRIHALYYIDDANTSIVYTGDWGKNNSSSAVSVPDYTSCHDNTFTMTTKSISGNIYQLEIPFEGTGITIYAVLSRSLGTNVTFSIDGGPPIRRIIDPETTSQPSFAYNFTMFNNQSLPDMHHSLTMTLDTHSVNVIGNDTLIFDYAAVTDVKKPTTISPASESSKRPPLPTSAKVGIGVGVTVVVLILIWRGFLRFRSAE